MNKNVLLCGVGGQGTVLASKLIAGASMRKGLPVMSAETIGMAQKGGSVFSHLRIGDHLHAPMLAPGTADLFIAFEPAEAVRMLSFLKEGGTVVVNSAPVVPVNAVLKKSTYHGGEMIDYLRANVAKVIVVDGAAACAELGSSKVLNMVLLGAALESGELPVTKEEVAAVMKERVKPRFVEMNSKALAYYATHRK